MAAPTPAFDITPEKQAGLPNYFYRQLLVTPKPVRRDEADLRGKTAIITGSNTGLGLEVARQLLDLGLSTLILAVRDPAKGDIARQNLSRGRNSNDTTNDVWTLDLLSYESITAFAEKAKCLERLDIAIMNAGVFKIEEEFHQETGFELDIQINYLSTVLLATLLLPTLRKDPAARPARLVFVSSDNAGWTPFPERSARLILEAFKEKMPKWDFGERYGTSKLLGQLFLTQLVKRVPASIVTIDCAGPGLSYGSGLARDGKGKALYYVFRIISRVLGRSCNVGARSITHAAVSLGEEVHGQYVGDSKLEPKAPLIYEREGDEIGRKLWEETLAELSFANVRGIIDSFN